MPTVDAIAQLNTALAGRYTLEREIGAGGMATVYLARDVKHNRRVALKVLKPELGAVLGVERFLSEIQVTANLQHPNLLPLFDSGEANGLLFYVMPFVEGESLRARLEREKQLPVEEAVHIAVAVASALAYAHAQHVIHRDLKPENILLQAGQPVVADFGIALAVTKAGGARITQTGLSLGTPQYMSPEQATGDRVIDGRSDIYSLAAVTYELLTGEPPHTGTTAQAIIARVLTEHPRSVRASRPNVPEYVEVALEHALEKLPADRWHTAGEFANALLGKGAGPPLRSVAPALASAGEGAGRGWSADLHSPVGLALLGATLIAVAYGTWEWRAAHTAEPRTTVRFTLSVDANERIATSAPWTTVASSPDGRTVAYIGTGSTGVSRLFLRSLDELHPRTIAGSEGAEQPFFSPDAKWVGFVVKRQLRKARVDGGTPVPVSDVSGAIQGASWGPNDQIVISTLGGLAVVQAGGGAPRVFTKLDSAHGETGQRWPHMLSDGKTVLYTSWQFTLTTARIGVASIETGQTTILDSIPGTFPLGVFDGQLIYVSPAGALTAVPFDARQLRPSGKPVLIVDGIQLGSLGGVSAGLSPSGLLVYQTGSVSRQVVLADAHGNTRVLIPQARDYTVPRFSPDGKRIALTVAGASGTSTDVWIYDIASATLTPFTTEGRGNNDRPEWTPDGSRVLFHSNRAGRDALWSQPSDLSGLAAPVPQLTEQNVFEGVFTPDARSLIYRTGTVGTAVIWYRRLDGDTARKPIATAAAETQWAPRPSPDGRWVAYSSDESGERELWVQPFPGPGARIQVSIDGGEMPVWSRDGHRLFYLRGGRQIVAATVTTAPRFAVTARQMLIEGDFYFAQGHAGFDVSADGNQFLLLKPIGGDPQTIVAYDWRHELRARMAGRASK